MKFTVLPCVARHKHTQTHHTCFPAQNASGREEKQLAPNYGFRSATEGSKEGRNKNTEAMVANSLDTFPGLISQPQIVNNHNRVLGFVLFFLWPQWELGGTRRSKQSNILCEDPKNIEGGIIACGNSRVRIRLACDRPLLSKTVVFPSVIGSVVFLFWIGASVLVDEFSCSFGEQVQIGLNLGRIFPPPIYSSF